MNEDLSIYVVDDDDAFRDSVRELCESVGHLVVEFSSATDFLEVVSDEMKGCVILDVRMAGMSGVELHSELLARHFRLPVIFVSGHGDIPMAVSAMKNGAFDFLTKPFSQQELLDRINAALRTHDRLAEEHFSEQDLTSKHEKLTPREAEVMGCVTQGLPNKVIASKMDISQRTVEIHRANVMEKMEAESLADLVRMEVALHPSV